MSKELFGFVAEKQGGSGEWLVSPATSKDGAIRAHDLSGFMGSWDVNKEHQFFESISGAVHCSETMDKAYAFAKGKNDD